MTAAAAGKKAPSLKGCSGKESLRIYRAFTQEIMKSRSEKELPALREVMYARAFTAGKMLGRLPGIRTDEARNRLARLLYRNIGIRLESRLPEEMCVKRCAFAGVYSPRMCYVMSGLDEGILCGIFGGESLRFDRRLTEGAPVCHARIYREGE